MLRFTSCIYLVSTAVQLIQGVAGSCSEIDVPWHGVVNCTDGVNSGSICFLSCDEFYDLVGTIESQYDATCSEFDTWIGPTEFECRPITCGPEHQAPKNGDLICTADNVMASLCIFLCDGHFDFQDLHDNAVFSMCKDDGDGDEFGVWTNPQNVVFPPPCTLKKCPYELDDPENGHVACTAKSYAGSACVYYCNQGYDMVGKVKRFERTSCVDPVDGPAFWTNEVVPVCRKCDINKNVKIIALIHSENQKDKFSVAAKLISRLVGMISNQNFKVHLRVQRYNSHVDTEYFETTSFRANRDKKRLETLPYSGSGENTEAALQYASHHLSGMSDGRLQVILLVTDKMKENETAVKIAEEMRSRGVMIFALGILGKENSYFEDGLAMLTGSSDQVFNIVTNRHVVKTSVKVARQISDEATKRGCAKEQ